MQRREFVKLLLIAAGSLFFEKDNIKMPIQNYSQDYVVELLKRLYQQSNVLLPQSEFDTLQRLVDEERANAEKQKAWLRPQDGRIGSAFLDLPFGVIQSTVLETDKAEFVIPIPSNFKHLMIMGSCRTTGAGVSAAAIDGQFNGDTGASNYGAQRLTGANASVSSAVDTTYDKIHLGISASDGAEAGENGFFVAFVFNYNSPSFFKSVLALEGYFLSTSPAGWTSIFVSQWYSTAPVTSMRIFPASDSLKSGSLISVYGIQ